MVCLLLCVQGHIVAEVCDLDNEPLVKMVGVEHVQTVVSHDIIGRLMIQCARQHGLASVWQKIMGFEGAVLPLPFIRVSIMTQAPPLFLGRLSPISRDLW